MSLPGWDKKLYERANKCINLYGVPLD